ncbi:MAG TPA: hypothetical protein VFZ53_03835 [Polyangiaceae bacterium]
MSSDPDLASSLALVIAPERLDAFAHSTGFRLERLILGAIAGYDLGTLYLGELDGAAASDVRARFSARLVEGGIVKSEQGVHRIVGTTASGDVRALVTVDDRHVAFVSGDATLARIVEAYAKNRLRSPTVLRGAGLRELPAPAPDALLAFLAPGPFSEEWGSAAQGVVATADAVSVEARTAPGGRLKATLTLAGTWTRDDGPLEKLELAWKDLAQSPTGRLLGLDQASPVTARFLPQSLTLSAELPAGPLARGLRHATSADVREILELGAPSPIAPP